jgi:hypothetical protein
MRFPIRRNSTAVHRLTVNPITGSARVQFTSSTKTYRFTHVSRLAILAAAWHSPRSLGQWVNWHCLQDHQTWAV